MALKILVAEDDRHTRRILDHIFTKDPAFRDQDVQLFLAPDGEEALQIFERESPDLVISDLLMPRLDGFALCRAIRRLPNGKDVPVIVTSAIYKETALLNRMRDELGVEFFAKPFQVRELVRGVQRMLEKRQRNAGAAAGAPGEIPPPPPASNRRATGEHKPIQGELRNRPLAALILDFLEDQITGVLTLRRGRVKKEIYIILGHPVGAESNIRTETLGHYLVAKNVLDEQQHQTAIATARDQHLSLMETFVQLGWLNETDVFRHHTALVKLKIINSLRWYDGTYLFTPGDTFSDRVPKATIDIANILFLGLKRVTSLDEVSKKLDQEANRAVKLTTRAERYQDAFVKVFGDDVLKILPSQPTINEMLSKGLDPLKVYIHTHALMECGIAELGVTKADEVSQPPMHTEDPIGLRQLKQEATRIPDLQSSDAAADGLLYEEIFGVDEISVVASMPVPGPPRSRPGAEDSGEVAIHIELDDEGIGDPGRMSTADARKLVVTTYLGIHDKTYYEILGVPRTAPPPEIRDGYEQLSEKFKVENFKDCDLGLDHPKLEEINHLIRQCFNTLIDPAKRAAYDEDRRKEESIRSSDPMEAESYFQIGRKLLVKNDPRKAAEAFKRAVSIDPDSPDYNAYLGWAIYESAPDDPDAQRKAVHHLDQALAINPDELQAHIFHGTLSVRMGNTSDGRDHLERALDLDPGNEDAFTALADIHTMKGEWKLLERQHRKVLHRLGNRQPERVVSLWKSLANVYKEHLNDLESARTSLEVAASIAPDDQALAAALRAVSLPDQTKWRDTAEGLKSLIAKNPSDSGPLGDLYTLYRDVSQHDAAFVAASLLVVQGQAAGDSESLYNRFKPRFLVRMRRNVDADVWQKIRHSDDDPQTSSLFETLSLLDPSFDFEVTPPTEPETPLALEQWPEDFARVMSYLCGVLALPSPNVSVRQAPHAPAVLVNPIAPTLLLHEGLVNSTDRLELAVHLSRLVPYFWAGRAFGNTMHTKQLRNVLMGAMKAVAPRLKVDDPTGAIDRIRGRLASAPPEVITQLGDVIQALTKERSSLNITRWMKGMARSADRLSLLIVGDLPTVLRHSPSSAREDAVADLQIYALSTEHLELRDWMATSIQV